jgi:multicomponent Na+:H+ antiporter subunit E
MVLRISILLLALALTWLAWSGLYKPLLISLGLLSVVLTFWLCWRMGLLQRSVFALDLVHRMLGFWASLLVDIVRSNLVVARIILSPRLPISPTLVQLEPGLEGQVGLATLANSVTLTPSTVTIDAHHGVMLVHCLTVDSARETRDGELDQRLRKALGDR